MQTVTAEAKFSRWRGAGRAIATTLIVTTALALFTPRAAQGQPSPAGWRHKAVMSTKLASSIAPLTVEDRTLYSRSAAKIGPHKIGRFTIAQVVARERASETQAANASAQAMQVVLETGIPLVVVGLAVYLLVIAVRASDRHHREQREQAIAQRRQVLQRGLSRELTPIGVSIILAPDEHCYFSARAIEYSVHTERQYGGSYGGPSIRVARGIYLRGGVSGGSSRSVQSVRPDGAGELYITNRRIIFVGDLRTNAVDLKSIVRVQPLPDGLGLDLANHTPIRFETGDAGAYIATIRIMAGQLEPYSDEAIAQTLKEFDATNPL